MRVALRQESCARVFRLNAWCCTFVHVVNRDARFVGHRVVCWRMAQHGARGRRHMPEKLGDATDTELTEARAKSVAGDKKQIILTFVNKVRLDFAKTWAYHVVRLGLTNYLIGATDVGALTGLHKLNLPCFSMRTNLPDVEWDWGSPSFKALGQHKVELIFKALTWGLELVITDCDALVLREPFAYMARWPDASFLTTSDCLGNTTGSDDGGLEDHGCLGQAMNIGYMYFAPSALPMVQSWLRLVAKRALTMRCSASAWDSRQQVT